VHRVPPRTWREPRPHDSAPPIREEVTWALPVARAVCPFIAPAILLGFSAQNIPEEDAVREDEQQGHEAFFAFLDKGCMPAVRPSCALCRAASTAGPLMSSVPGA
jgi:hypothetical protein